jgi:hypothetical protein
LTKFLDGYIELAGTQRGLAQLENELGFKVA